MLNNKQNIEVVILAGSRDLGRCPITSRIPTSLWPIGDKTAVECVLTHLANQGIKQVTICSNGDGLLLAKTIHTDNRLEVEFLNEALPVGTAGCIRDVACNKQDALILILPASIFNPPEIDMLVQAHRNGQSDLTVVFNPGNGSNPSFSKPAGIYICETSVLKYIPKEGYFDIKEELIPKMLQDGKTVHIATLPHHMGNFRNHEEYLYAVTNYLEKVAKEHLNLPASKRTDSCTLWMASNSKVDSSVRTYGPVVIMDGACISNGAVILGPTIIGRNVSIGRDSVIVNSVIWDDAEVGSNCELQRCVVGYHATVRSNAVVEGKAIPFKPKTILGRAVSSALKAARDNTSRLQPKFDKLNEKLPHRIESQKINIASWFGAGLVLIAFLWSYWPTISDLWNVWQQNDEYSSGLLVPFLAVYILWSRRQDITECQIGPSIWGLFAFLGVQSIRLFGVFFMYGSAERLSLVLSIAALVLFLFGWQLFRKVFTVLLFLFLMLPWPNRVQTAVALYLQQWATSSAVFCLEMIGYNVLQEGNVIHIGQATVAVAEACNGLRMITAFFVISSLVILLVKRELWEKLLILASSLPIALFCNTVRLAVTAIAFTILSGEYWEKIFHDFGGYAMMPLAIGMVVAELWLLTKITTAPSEKQVVLASK
ncbi:MAG: exosortase [Phycisphaerae bacterium]|jgi:exosortase